MVAAPLYGRLLGDPQEQEDPSKRLATRLRELADHAGLPCQLRTEGVELDALPQLAHEAEQQWTGTFNPRPLTTVDALEIYRCAF